MIWAVLMADLLTGLFHWLEDTYCTRGMGGPLGNQVCDPNLLHHEDQAAMLSGGFFHRNWTSFAIAAPFAIVAAAMNAWWWVVVAVVAGLGNEVHAWSHRRPSHWAPRMLQEMGIAQSPHQHARHHRKPHTECYCVITNLLNPILDRLRFWRALEAVVEASTGVKPRREQEA